MFLLIIISNISSNFFDYGKGKNYTKKKLRKKVEDWMSIANNSTNNPTRSISPAPTYNQPTTPNDRVVFPVIKNAQT